MTNAATRSHMRSQYHLRRMTAFRVLLWPKLNFRKRFFADLSQKRSPFRRFYRRLSSSFYFCGSHWLFRYFVQCLSHRGCPVILHQFMFLMIHSSLSTPKRGVVFLDALTWIIFLRDNGSNFDFSLNFKKQEDLWDNGGIFRLLKFLLLADNMTRVPILISYPWTVKHYSHANNMHIRYTIYVSIVSTVARIGGAANTPVYIKESTLFSIDQYKYLSTVSLL